VSGFVSLICFFIGGALVARMLYKGGDANENAYLWPYYRYIVCFLLQRGRVLRYDKQLGALRFLDMTIVKFMLSSVLVGMVGVYFLKDLGWQRYQSNR